MKVILFQKRFSGLVLTEDKLQTIRQRARCKPEDVLSLREWTGLPYRSKQREIHRRICTAVKPVRLCFAKDGKFIVEVNGRPVKSREAFAKADGFHDFDDMVKWFLDTHGMEEFNGELIVWSKATALERHQRFEFPKSVRFGYTLATLKVDHTHWLNDYDTDPDFAERCLTELEGAAHLLKLFTGKVESEVKL